MKTCFIISPIGDESSETRKRSDQLLNHIIAPVAEKNGFETIRVDKISSTNEITKEIIDYLKKSDLVIADITDHNPNCFYEIGFRSALNKPMILIRQQSENLPFDIQTIRTINYDLTDLDKVTETKNKISETISKLSAFDADMNESEDFDTTVSAFTQVFSSFDNQLSAISESLISLNAKFDSIEPKYVSAILSEFSKQNQTNPQDALFSSFFEKVISANPAELSRMMNNVETISKLTPKS